MSSALVGKLSPWAPRFYSDGNPWRDARGRAAPREAIETEFKAEQAVIDLSNQPPVVAVVKALVREMRIRYYSTKSVTNYRSALVGFLRWYRGRLDEITQEDIRSYLELLVDGGASSSHVSVTLSALRTGLDKFCLLRCTVGLVSPRKSTRLPVVLSKSEVQRMIEAARSFRDKLLLSVLYSTGLRVSEVACLRLSDFDFERKQIRVRQGKGQKDRYVMLADELRPLMRALWKHTRGEGYLFPSEGQRSDKHLSTRTIERVVVRARGLAGISKKATPHSFRHSFATHLIESGTDIRFIQKLLGHTNLETTSLYTKVARASSSTVDSPLDQLRRTSGAAASIRERVSSDTGSPSVGRMRLDVKADQAKPGRYRVELAIRRGDDYVSLPGMTATVPRPGWVCLNLPAEEQWSEPLGQLPVAQRERLESPEFFHRLQTMVAAKLSQELGRAGPGKPR
ncbi:MAG: site-specific tyrosine recombinase/integron integrase [Planctomycetota bacterium]